jgi:hypothetical protein
MPIPSINTFQNVFFSIFRVVLWVHVLYLWLSRKIALALRQKVVGSSFLSWKSAELVRQKTINIDSVWQIVKIPSENCYWRDILYSISSRISGIFSGGFDSFVWLHLDFIENSRTGQKANGNFKQMNQRCKNKPICFLYFSFIWCRPFGSETGHIYAICFNILECSL